MLKRNRMAAALEALPQLSLVIIGLPLASCRSRKGSGSVGNIEQRLPQRWSKTSNNHILAVGPLYNHPRSDAIWPDDYTDRHGHSPTTAFDGYQDANHFSLIGVSTTSSRNVCYHSDGARC